MHQLRVCIVLDQQSRNRCKKSFGAAKAIDSNTGIDTYIYPKGHITYALYEQTNIPENQSVKYPQNNQIYYLMVKRPFIGPRIPQRFFK